MGKLCDKSSANGLSNSRAEAEAVLISVLPVLRPPTQTALSAFPSFTHSRMPHSLAFV